MLPQNQMTPLDMLAILRRRKWSLILPALLIVVAAICVALLLPSIYKSTATILIEEQEVPADFVQGTVTGYAEQRIQTINQRIMTYTVLQDIMNRFNLYPDLREKLTTDQIVAKMRQDIRLEPISADFTDRRTGRPTATTIAFSLSFEQRDPNTVHQVANELASLFLKANLRNRERQTLETTLFVEDEMNKVKAELAELGGKISDFKAKHINRLPDMAQVNLQSLNNIENTAARLGEQLRGLREKREYLQSQLANTPRELEINDKKRLDQLKLELVHLRARFSDHYPDVIKAKAEIAELEAKVAGQLNAAAASPQADNPAYITLAAQLAGVQSDLSSAEREIKELDQSAQQYRRRIQSTPRVEEPYRALLTEQAGLQAKYSDLMKKLMEARVAQGLEKEQKGERFTLLEAARFPEKPYKPNRLAILLIGVVLAVGAGVGTLSLREFMDHTVRDGATLSLATSFPVLATIPEIASPLDITRRRIKKTCVAAGSLLAAAGGLTAFHFYIMDLGIFWLKLQTKINLLLS